MKTLFERMSEAARPDDDGKIRPFVCRHRDPRCVDDPCPAGVRWLCEERLDPTPNESTPNHG